MNRRRLLHTVCLSIAIGLCGVPANTGYAETSAASYPSQMVRIVVPFSAGSATDILARVIADKLGQSWKQQVIVENRPGVAGTAGVAKAAPDGYTIMLTSNGHTIVGKINKNLPFDPVNDFVGIAKVASMPMILITAPDSSAKSLSDFIAAARSKPGKASYASAGLGSAANIAGELFKQAAKLDMMHVPYRGTPDAQTSVMRADTDMFFTPAGNSVDLILTGKVRALAISSAARLPNLPNVPTFAEAGLPQFVYDAWFGIFAPAGTPAPVLQKINKDVGAVMTMPEIRELLLKQGVAATSSSLEEFAALIKADTARFGQLMDSVQK
jgi:tripartite-type tricarboxylate transporter receptor subunit TctC